MSIICISILAFTIVLSDTIINGKLQVSRRLFNWIEKVSDRSQNQGDISEMSE
ncbi:MAG: hypothetical protein F6K25_15315 [Okeania sp. SIO2G4]|uniref:hypothetical protein n=1 Tax=unclassified Okeania TaxID=2634635 RepID=UPI0013BDF117|nr:MULTISPECIES: hypothetical protein [unclassified Okeania]NEP04105.1 hypothetical protein [Okeania sp. SIO4D6]NEP38288.1 hypothetical protein [Okeania sp. SIO2H7]NEP75290.1 hypothetical protein [Okeania sp. SIO2G5]NEP96042.1 hypothetical protein [Okeania sp. SIO2F5]NEQ91991.1 hypothetical protein [Okeania sp. SIO2G4]